MNKTHYWSHRQIMMAVAFFKANPDGQIRIDWSTNWDRAAFRTWLIKCIHVKASRGTIQPTGRKTSDEWQRSAQRTQRLIQGRCVLRTNDVHPDLRKKLSTRIH